MGQKNCQGGAGEERAIRKRWFFAALNHPVQLPLESLDLIKATELYVTGDPGF